MLPKKYKVPKKNTDLKISLNRLRLKLSGTKHYIIIIF